MTTLVVAVDRPDGETYARAHGIPVHTAVIVTPRSLHAARGFAADGVTWTARASFLPIDVQLNLHWQIAPSLHEAGRSKPPRSATT